MTGYGGSSDGGLRGRRLYQDRESGVIFGVCTGIADYFGFDVMLTRIAAAVSLFFFTFPTFVAYILLALLLPKKPRALYGPADPEREELRRQVRSSPHSTLDSARHRFREIEERIQRMEKYLTSSRFKLDREFEALKD
jgi:phage shock protein C